MASKSSKFRDVAAVLWLRRSSTLPSRSCSSASLLISASSPRHCQVCYAVLDAPVLALTDACLDTCYQCLRSEEPQLVGSLKYAHAGADKLRACTGCQTVKYCSKNCQALS